MPNGNGMGPGRTAHTSGYGRGGRGFYGAFGGRFGAGPGRGYGRRPGIGGRVIDDLERPYGTCRRLSEDEYKEALAGEVEYLENRLKTLKAELDSTEKDSE